MFDNHRLEKITSYIGIANTSPINNNFTSINDIASWVKRTQRFLQQRSFNFCSKEVFVSSNMPANLKNSNQIWINLVADDRSHID
jgi:hypothetical protein